MEKTKFTVCFRMVCNGSVEIEAESADEAALMVEGMSAMQLSMSSVDTEVEIVSE